MIRPRHAFVAVFAAATAIMVGRYAALAVLVLIGLPVLWLGKGAERLGNVARKRVSMTRLAGPSRFYPCVYCGRPGESWDHVIPWSRGGDDGPGNRLPCCTPCNSSKGDDTPEEWWSRVGHGAPFPAHWPRTGVTR